MTIDFSKIHFNTGLIAGEILKRGIDLRYLGNTNVLEANYNGHIEIIDETDLSLMPSTYRNIFDDKYKTKLILNQRGFSTVKGKSFSPVDSDKALEYVQKELNYPVVIKAVTGTHGYQVKMNIYNDEDFVKTFEKLAKYTSFYIDLLVEQQVFCNEYRITITKNGFFAVANRQPANVVGDGKKTLKQLVQEVNYNRINFRTTCLCEIRLDEEVNKYLDLKGLDLEYIPKDKEKVYLRMNSNISTGGDCIDVTDLICEEYKNLAKKLLYDFPGLPYIGIDLLTGDISKFGEYYICELNPAPGISIHTHPGNGISRDLPKYLVDMLYPETINLLQDNYNRFILSKDFNSIKQLGEHFVKNYPKNYYYRPLQIEIELTNKCNFRCQECAIIDDVEKGEYGLDKDFIINMLNGVKGTGIYSYSITGGEPFLRFSDMCDIIENVDLDCHKIQTNGSFFSTDKKANLYLKGISESGFGKNNKYLKPSLRISFGISNSQQKNYWDKIKYSTKNFYKYFDKQKTTLGFVVSDDFENISNTRENFISSFEKKVGIPFDKQNYYIRQIYIQPKIKDIFKDKKQKNTTIKDFIDNNENQWSCFGINENIPWPKLLIKANGDVYSCTCFSQVFLVGNVKEKPITQIIQEVNNHEIIKIISANGLKGFLDYAQKICPGIGEIKIPNNLTQCNVCRIIKDKIKND